MASWRSFSTRTAFSYSSFFSVFSSSVNSEGFFWTARVSRGGAALRTDARPVLATFIWAPAALATLPMSQA
ncbi:hypothetical protein CP979_26010 [Streptomyces filamentosus]|nr:hypothetical protein CP979_26010 [Streptomyces filamentosus]